MAWKTVLLGVAAYILGVVMYFAGLVYGDRLQGPGVNMGGFTSGDIVALFTISTFGLIPGIVTTPLFFALYWLFREKYPERPELAWLSMPILAVLSFLLGVGVLMVAS